MAAITKSENNFTKVMTFMVIRTDDGDDRMLRI